MACVKTSNIIIKSKNGIGWYTYSLISLHLFHLVWMSHLRWPTCRNFLSLAPPSLINCAPSSPVGAFAIYTTQYIKKQTQMIARKSDRPEMNIKN